MDVVIGQRHIAVGTNDHIATASTRNKGTVAPSMDKQDALLLAFFNCSNADRSDRLNME